MKKKKKSYMIMIYKFDITFKMATFGTDFKIPELTQEQTNELKAKFDKADTDHNGKLDKNEITEVLKSQKLPTDNVEMIMKMKSQHFHL